MRHFPRALALFTAATLMLTGCSSLLEQEYTHITPHNAAPTTEGDPSTLRADSYQELVNALIYLIGAGMERGTIRLYMDDQDLNASLDAACLEVQEDPLGAYAVEYITYGLSSVVAYSEATVNITYRRTKEQVSSIVKATGTTAIRSELAAAMSVFNSECVLRISYFEEDEDFIRSLARQAYYNAPASAFGMPELQVSLYPDSGQQRIVEIQLTYPYDQRELERRSAALSQWLDEMSASLTVLAGDARYLDAAQTIRSAGSYDPSGGVSVDSLLETGRANSEGISLATAALYQYLGLSSRVVEGTLAGQPHFWVMIQTHSGWRHLDLTVEGDQGFSLYTDKELSKLGYVWDTNLFPVSVSTEESATGYGRLKLPVLFFP